MPSYKLGRTEADLRLALTELFREIKDPRVSKLISIIKIDLSSDMSYATVYVSAIEGCEKTAESVKGLKSAAGFLRREIGARMKIRKSPELRFVADNSIEHSANIARIINGMDIPKETEDENEQND